jgi:hypothetical protein
MLSKLFKNIEFWQTSLRGFSGRKVDWDMISDISKLGRRKDNTGVYQRGLWETMSLLHGRDMDAALVDRLAKRFAGNETALLNGETLVIFGQRSTVPAHVAVVQIGDIHHGSKTKDNKLLYVVQMTAISGYLAGDTWNYFSQKPFLVALSRRIGFGAPWSKYPLHRLVELSGLYFYAALDTKADDQIRIQELKEAPTLVTWNRTHVLGLRCRAKQACPEGFTHPCYQCVAGRDKCPAGTHAKTYVRGECSVCGDPSALMDPGATSPRCVKCAPAVP